MNFAKTAFHPLYERLRKQRRAYHNREMEFGAYRRWLTQHEGGSYKQFYVDTIKGHLIGEGGRHSTGRHPIWQQWGDAILHRLIARGLRPDDLVVDYGCGTLREGVHLIRYLAKGRYIGLDIDERILTRDDAWRGRNCWQRRGVILLLSIPRHLSKPPQRIPRGLSRLMS